ncbi:MAG: pilus assembly protein PilW [Vibrio sp.]
MALKSAKYQGNSLIEFMIAALIGVIALGIIGGVFLANQKAAAQRSKQIMLQQQMSSVMQQMKEDIQRAGFAGIETYSLMLSGASSVLFHQANQIGYVYRLSSNSVSNTVYRLNNHMLQYCQNETPLPLDIASVASGCFDLFMPSQIKVVQFDVSHSLLQGASVDSALLAITMAAELKNDPTISHTIGLTIQQRNWQ